VEDRIGSYLGGGGGQENLGREHSTNRTRCNNIERLNTFPDILQMIPLSDYLGMKRNWGRGEYITWCMRDERKVGLCGG
jgi:hypothetical protein